jgi:RWD domain
MYIDTTGNYIEEQEQEIEALEAIFPDEFKKTCDNPLQWQVHLIPHPNEEGDNHGTQ